MHVTNLFPEHIWFGERLSFECRQKLSSSNRNGDWIFNMMLSIIVCLKWEDLGTYHSLWWLSLDYWGLLLPPYLVNTLCNNYVPAGCPAGMTFLFPRVKNDSNYRCLEAAMGKAGDESRCFSDQERLWIKDNYLVVCRCFCWEVLSVSCNLYCFRVNSIQDKSIFSGESGTRVSGGN